MQRHLHLIISLLLYTVCAGTAWAASVKISVGSQEGAPKSDIAVPISLAGASAVGAIEFDLAYDANVCTATKIEKGALAANTMLESSVSKPGRVRIALVSQAGISGDGVLATVHFTAAASAGKSNLAIEDARAWVVPKAREGMAGTQHLIDAQVIAASGTLAVTGQMPWWIFGGAFIVLLLLLAAYRKTRRRAVVP